MKLLVLIFIPFFISCTQATSRVASKKNFLQKDHQVFAHGKSRGYFNIKIDAHTEDDSEVELTATIQSHQDFPEAQVEWKLPKTIKTVDNQAQSFDLKANQETQTSMTLKTKDLKEGDQIFVFVYKMINGERHGGTQSYVYHKNPEDSAQKSLIKKASKKRKFIE